MKISSPRHLNRRRQLEALVTEAGNATALAVKVGVPKSHISALLAGARGIGDTLAAKLERKFEKAVGWMDAGSLTMAELNGYEGQLVTLFRQLSAEDQQGLLGTLSSRVAPVPMANFAPGAVRLPPTPTPAGGPGVRKNEQQKRRPAGKQRKER